MIIHKGEQFGLQELSKKHSRITEVEKKIVSARCTGISICQMESAELTKELEGLLVKVSVISGHGLPELVLFAETLVIELKNFLLVYGYETLTPSEILLAFRFNCLCNLRYPTGVEVRSTEIFGRYISVDYVSKVLSSYRGLRNALDNNLKYSLDGY